MTAVSFWLDRARDGFSQTCVEYFGVNFEGYKLATNQHVSRPPKVSTRQFPTRDAARKRGTGAMLSTKAMQRSTRLVG